MNFRSLSVLLVVFTLSSVPAPVAADAIVPISLAAVEGNASTVFPFVTAGSMRYQQVYAASEFGPTSIWIDAILFRPDSGAGQPFFSTFPSVQVNLSTTSAGLDGLSSTFAANVGADNTMVRSGPVTLSSVDVVGPGNTRAFDIIIPFTTSFLYNPTLGNLLLDVRVGTSFASVNPLDAHSVVGDSISRTYAFDMNALVGNVNDTSGLVTKFQTHAVSAVPDAAASLPLLVMGVGSVLFAARRWGTSI
jgi:hypothetical protein